MSHSRPEPIPPSYSASLHESITSSETYDTIPTSLANDLPTYSSCQHPRNPRRETPETKGFLFAVNQNRKEVVALEIIAIKSFSKHIPTVLQDSPVRGTVYLNLDKPETIQSVVISVRGNYLTGASPDQHRTFLELTHTLWSPTQGDPRHSRRSDGSSLSNPAFGNVVDTPSPFTGKLSGKYSWPFAIDLPKEVSITCGKNKKLEAFALPQTFNERYARGSIDYELVLRISRSRLRPDYRIPARFGYIPLSRPPPLPALRHLSYREGVPLLGPTIDPEGWFSEAPVTAKGTIFSNRTVHVSCTLCLAKPLCYTRCTLIPLFLRLESDDQQALDLLSTPKAIVANLRRRIQYHPNPTKAQGTYALRDTVSHYGPAIWWPSTEGSEEDLGRFRFFTGEIHLSSDVKPTSAMGDFRLEYSVVLSSFDVAGFEPLDKQHLVEYPVDVVTCFASGPRPRRYAPPGYESAAGPRDFLFPD
ncbi:hypothetical protein CPB84DRAFT_1772347 [Gymnopilus junonius]|uniref:Arrestin-like N-terminal domain-containing protein n=1 Tax=Gymnopilus junonius TaxID=109634 RepID=A0A9P5NSE5_GYMJU|nr:hypothetical protein CPB84DRAFT_1772347 [Gymnopilus junonius]